MCSSDLITSGVISFDLAGNCQITVSQNGTDNGSPTAYLPATSVVESITVLAVVPAAVTGLTLLASSDIIDANWDAISNSNDGGAPITGYQLTWYVATSSGGTKPTESALDASIGTTTHAASYGRMRLDNSTFTQHLTGLTNGVTYTIEIQAINRVGIGPIK